MEIEVTKVGGPSTSHEFVDCLGTAIAPSGWDLKMATTSSTMKPHRTDWDLELSFETLSSRTAAGVHELIDQAGRFLGAHNWKIVDHRRQCEFIVDVTARGYYHQ